MKHSNKDFTYGISYKTFDFGFKEERFTEASLHEVKVIAGTEFQKGFVKSVFVFDPNGVNWLYLKKTPQGIHREEK